MRNIMIKIEYDGTNYNGWQIQPNGVTIQEEIMKAIKKITSENVVINGSGRTDARVHAKGQVANFYTSSNISIKKLPLAINHFLPKDIAIIEAKEVPDDFHARYSAIGKVYSYQIHTRSQRSPLLRNYSYHIPYKLDIKQMEKAVEIFKGTHDFKGFMSSGSSSQNTIRTIYDIIIVKEKDNIRITFQGSGFLYNMVRIMVGTLVEVGRGKRDISTVKEALETGIRLKAGHSAPPQGLFLDKVLYPLTR